MSADRSIDLRELKISDIGAGIRVTGLATQQDINRVVDLLRRERFGTNLGYVPPILSDKELPPLVKWGVKNEVVGPNSIASCIFNNSLKRFNGIISGLDVEVTPPDLSNLSFSTRIVRPELITSLAVNFALFSYNNEPIGTARRLYTLYLAKLNEGGRWPFALRRYALKYYSRDDLEHKSILWVASRLTDKMSLEKLIEGLNRDGKKAIRKSREIAEEVEREALKHPFQGGLPTLGKDR